MQKRRKKRMLIKKLLRVFLVLSASVGIIIFANIEDIRVDFSKIDGLLYKPNVKAFLDTIAYAEGTSSDLGYRMLYTGLLFDDFKDHPRKKICAKIKKGPICSTAAGRYQFLARVWDRVAPEIGAKDFSPVNQDRAAISLIRIMGGLKHVRDGDFEKAVKKLNLVWASLPGSKYGQRTVPMEELKRFYLKRRDSYLK